ncbi:39S ribosomal protein L48, mitochondrial [Chionoecetes opilio]|uniref:39S ribosomal protein L48, mitochondrial n=1 Tax=Chionoecetes opilio TaxID=41210 RepID=A0A8J4XMZ3_CHIOP|nr:39S ribosomal protein L48, mitochondrial [Chionoecetes opilio]
MVVEEEPFKRLPTQLGTTTTTPPEETHSRGRNHGLTQNFKEFHSHQALLHSQLLALNVSSFDLATLQAAAGVPTPRRPAIFTARYQHQEPRTKTSREVHIPASPQHRPRSPTMASLCRVYFCAKVCVSPQQAAGPEVPDYDAVNVQIKGYDFTVLEHYGKWIHSTAVHMGIDVEDCWATPCAKLHIQTFKPRSIKLQADYHLQVYERNIQLADLPSITAPVFLEVIQAGLPEGVELSMHEHEPEHSEIRYIPDLELRTLHNQLDELGGPSRK